MSSQIQKKSIGASNAEDITEWLEGLSKRYILIAPATAVPMLAEGCTVSMSIVPVNLASVKDGKFDRYTSGDVYSMEGGKLGVSKSVLTRIAQAAGVTWSTSESGRIDDGSNPYYCHYRVKGYWRAFDGQWLGFEGEKDVDLRDGSPDVLEVHENYKAKLKRLREGDRQPKSPESVIREARRHILSNAATKARLRGIRFGLGISTSYPKEELAKGFAIVRVAFNGQSSNPRLAEMFAGMIAESFLSGAAVLGLPSGEQDHQKRLPPPSAAPKLDESGDHYVDDDGYNDHLPVPEQEYEYDDPRDRPQQNRQQQARNQREVRDGADPDMVLRFSRSKNRKICDADVRDLEWISEKVSENLETGSSRYPDQDRKLLAAVRAELQHREQAQKTGGQRY